MKSASDYSDLEQAMLGRWIGSSRGQTYDYTFHPKHYFSLTISSTVEPAAKVNGYWDVRENKLHIGTSDMDTAGAPLELAEGGFSIIAPGGHRTDFHRQSA